MLRAGVNGETFVSATMCPQQCVLVCQYLNSQTFASSYFSHSQIIKSTRILRVCERQFRALVKLEQVCRPIGVLNRFTELRHSKVKYKFIFHKTSSMLSPSSLLKLPSGRFREVTVSGASTVLPCLLQYNDTRE